MSQKYNMNKGKNNCQHKVLNNSTNKSKFRS